MAYEDMIITNLIRSCERRRLYSRAPDEQNDCFLACFGFADRHWPGSTSTPSSGVSSFFARLLSSFGGRRS